MENKEEKQFAKIVTVVAIVIAIVALYFMMTVAAPTKPLAGQGASVGKADIGGEFTLIDQDGQPFGSEQLKGKPSLIYFGFTFCPDICPTSLQKLTSVMDTLDRYKIDVTPVFITIDPQRDTSASLKVYLAHFHKKFMGLTGSPEAIKKVADEFKVYYAIAPGSDPQQADYLLDHTSLVYLMDKNGEYLAHFHLESSPEEIVEYIRINLK
jgi:protein SCO1/2